MATNDYELIIEPRAGYLYGCMQGDTVTLGTAVSAVNELFEHVRSEGHCRIALVRKTPPLDIHQYTIIIHVVFNALSPDHKFAFVDSQQAFGIVCRALTQVDDAAREVVHGFPSLRTAEQWLMAA
jgi:hypothetical protein